MMKRVISAILAVMMVIPMLAACGKKDGGAIGGADGPTSVEISDSGAPQRNTAPTEEEKVTPTFMYFVSAKDANYDEATKTVEELQKKYDGKVNFVITNVDENPEAATNFSVEGQTPALIMLDTTNNISAFRFKTSDMATLEADIKAALGK